MSVVFMDTRRIAEVIEHASANVYDVTQEPYPLPPCDDPRHVAILGMYRVVYSHTLGRDRRTEIDHLFHHISISSVSGQYPNKTIALEILRAFGLPMDDRLRFGLDEEHRAIVAIAEIA